MTNKNENQETYYFYDKNFVEALFNPKNVEDQNKKKFQLEFEETKDENGKQCWKLVSDESIVKEVSVLDLSKREIKNIEGICNLTNLRILNLKNNQIKKLPEEIGKLTNLEELYLEDNQIEELPSEIGNLINFVILSLGHNQIKIIPKEIGNLTKLEFLKLSYNQIKKLPEEIGKLTNLEFLYLNNNQIKELPEEIGKLINLEELWLDYNQIEKLPSDIGKLTNLEELFLEGNESLGNLAKNYSIYTDKIIKEDKWFKIEVNSSGIRISKIHK